VHTTTGQPRYRRSRAGFPATSSSLPSVPPKKRLSAGNPAALQAPRADTCTPAQDGGAASPLASKPISDPCCQTRRTGRLSPVGSHNNAWPGSSALAMRQTWAPPGERSSSTQSRTASSVTMCAGLNIRQRVWRRVSPRRPASCSPPITSFRVAVMVSRAPLGAQSLRAAPCIASRLRLENGIRSSWPAAAARQRTLVSGLTGDVEAAEAIGDDDVELGRDGDMPAYDWLVHQGPEPLAGWNSAGHGWESPCELPSQAAPRYAGMGRRIEPRSARTAAAGRGLPKW
jgi:hypothetical protein